MTRLVRILILILTPAIVAFLTYGFMRHAFLTSVNPKDTSAVLVEIEPNMTFREICKRIQERGILRYWWSLEFLARFRKIDTSIHAGEYELNAAMNPRSILAKLMSGEIHKRKIMLKEGMSIWDLGKAVEDAGLMAKGELDRVLADPKLLAKAGIDASSFEGYLFPDTYFFSRPINGEQVVWRMLEEGEKHWPPEYTQRADELQLSRHEILTLASIIEKESGNVEEQPTISSVFHNRLKQGMKLQSDPTVIYGIPNFNGNLTKQDLQSPTPYNTYINYGLPPAPIANPGDSAIKAALWPRETSYLFFVADGTGKHVFSTTLQEHNEAVNLYQKHRARLELEPEPSPVFSEPTPAAP